MSKVVAALGAEREATGAVERRCDHCGMAATCDVNDCGVLAIGRCLDCKRAFCASHQARAHVEQRGSINQGTPLVDLCVDCYSRRERDRPPSRAEAAEAARLFLRNEAGPALDHVGVARRRLVGTEFERVRKSFGRGVKEIAREVEIATGWYLGPVRCQEGRFSDILEDPNEEVLPAALVDYPATERTMRHYEVIAVELIGAYSLRQWSRPFAGTDPDGVVNRDPRFSPVDASRAVRQLIDNAERSGSGSA